MRFRTTVRQTNPSILFFFHKDVVFVVALLRALLPNAGGALHVFGRTPAQDRSATATYLSTSRNLSINSDLPLPAELTDGRWESCRAPSGVVFECETGATHSTWRDALRWGIFVRWRIVRNQVRAWVCLNN